MCKKRNYFKKGKRISNTQIDKCMVPLIKFLRARNYKTVGCCCGHEKYPMTIIVQLRDLGKVKFYELFTNIEIPRKRRFYKLDSQGYYYLPEILISMGDSKRK